MPVPAIVAGAAAVAARLAAKKVAQEAAKKAAKTAAANARGLKAANKPTKAAKSGVGDNKKISVETRRGVLKNTPPARANRTRGGSLRTLRAEGKTGPNYQVEIQGKMYSLPAAEKKMAALRKLQGGKN